jgi:hypothetical protein
MGGNLLNAQCLAAQQSQADYARHQNAFMGLLTGGNYLGSSQARELTTLEIMRMDLKEYLKDWDK